MIDLSNFTPAQIQVYYKLQRGFEIRHPLTGNNICFLHDPQRRLKGSKIGITTFTALLNAGLLSLKLKEYPFETWVLKP